MPIGVSGKGAQLYGSARDVGNIVAGFYAAAYGFTWDESRTAFNSYDGGIEPPVSVFGQQFGYKMGRQLPENERIARRNLYFLVSSFLPIYQSYKEKKK